MLFTPKFAIGHIFVTPNGGLQPANASGTELSTIQDFSVDFTGKGVELRGQFLYAVDARVTDIATKGKFKVGQWSLEQLNNLFYAGTVTNTGNAIPYADELHTIPGSSPYTVTVTNTAGFVQPLTVAYASDLSNLDEVASGPTVGQYSVNPSTGVFTFAAADEGEQVLISYVATGTGASISIPNNLQGESPVVSLAAINAADGNGFLFPNCRVTGIKPLDLKNNAYAMNEVEFMVYCPFGQAVGQIIQQNF
jgi:hypothetical protein